jgi:lactate dehydrogenase-like 2-hydroxyacid dehydrogenase
VFREEDRGLTPEERAARCGDFDAILPTLGDGFTAAGLRRRGGPVPDPRHFGVGVNHIDVAAARAAGGRGDEHAGWP